MKKYDCKKELVDLIKYCNKKYIHPKDIKDWHEIHHNKTMDTLINKIKSITKNDDISFDTFSDCTIEVGATVATGEDISCYSKLVKENKILIINASSPSGRWTCHYRWDFKNKKVIEDAVRFERYKSNVKLKTKEKKEYDAKPTFDICLKCKSGCEEVDEHNQRVKERSATQEIKDLMLQVYGKKCYNYKKGAQKICSLYAHDREIIRIDKSKRDVENRKQNKILKQQKLKEVI